MKKFDDWFNQNLTIGAFPRITNVDFDHKEYDVIINVSDEYDFDVYRDLNQLYCIQTYWFPMNEIKRDVGLNSIFGALIIMFDCEKRGLNVYLHCRAGKNRSQ